MTWKSKLQHLLFRLQQNACSQSSRFTTICLFSFFLLTRKKYNEAKACSSSSINRLKSLNRRTLDVLASRLYFYYSYSYELPGDLAEIRENLFALHRIATLHRDKLGQVHRVREKAKWIRSWQTTIGQKNGTHFTSPRMYQMMLLLVTGTFSTFALCGFVHAQAEKADQLFFIQHRTPHLLINLDMSSSTSGMTPEERKEQEKKEEALHGSSFRVPCRPPWNAGMFVEELKQAFLVWRQSLARLEENEKLVLTPFEKNLDIWSQLWRVLERSDLLVMVVDAKDPLFYRCPDLEQEKIQKKRENRIKKKVKYTLLSSKVRGYWLRRNQNQNQNSLI